MTQAEAFPLRIVQWTTGNVGRRSVRAIASNPALQLVGCYAWSPDKVGRDVGVLCGIEPLGVATTDELSALLALDPDCVVYNPMWSNVDDLVTILEAGVNVVTTAAFITGHQAMTAAGTSVFRDAVQLLADGLGVDLDDIRCSAEYSQTTEDLHLPGDWTIERGCVAGMVVRWQGYVGERDVIEIRMPWRKGQTLEPDIPMEQMGYEVEIKGQPTITTKVDLLPPADFAAETLADFMVLGMIATAMPAVNAIPTVVAATPGIATYNDIPLTAPRGFLSGG
jgi:hypothetical protein